MKPEETIDFQVKLAWQSIGRIYNTVAVKYGTTWATGNVLLAIDIEKGTPVTSLGPRIGLEATSLSRILKALEERNLINRTPDFSDRRRVLVKLTSEGLLKRNDARKAVIEFNSCLKSIMSKRDFEGVIKKLDILNQALLSDEMLNFGKDF
jgi:MarR family transcriptional regulator, organic hydroperoxide resistance regulator